MPHVTTDGLAGEDSLEADLLAWGKVIRIETRGRRSGEMRQATIGFIETDDGALLVAAADDGAHWAQNLLANAHCRVELDGITSARRAVPLEGDLRRGVSMRLILKYGTPAEGQGNGPAFRLELDDTAEQA